jgi:hypothetical protein
VQERLNIVNETLAKASVDLLHFTISFMISFLCFAVMGCVMFGFKMTEFKTVTDAFHALFNMSIGDTGLWEEMRSIHPIAGTVYQYVFFLFMGFTMINIFLAIIMDSYAEVVGEARSRGAHTILHDLNKAQVRVKSLCCVGCIPKAVRCSTAGLGRLCNFEEKPVPVLHDGNGYASELPRGRKTSARSLRGRSHGKGVANGFRSCRPIGAVAGPLLKRCFYFCFARRKTARTWNLLRSYSSKKSDRS